MTFSNDVRGVRSTFAAGYRTARRRSRRSAGRQDLLSASPTAAACWRAAAPALRHVSESGPAAIGGAPPRAGRVASSAFILAMVTHWRTLMSSGQAAAASGRCRRQAPSHFLQARPPAHPPPGSRPLSLAGHACTASAASRAPPLARPSGRPRSTCRSSCSGRPASAASASNRSA